MKKIKTFLLIITLAQTSNLTSQTYSVTVHNENFEFLENANFAVDDDWSSPVFQVPIGFEFEFFDLTSDQIYSAYNSFGGYTSLNQDEDNLYMLIHFFANFIDRGNSQDTLLSPIYYQTIGIPGQRIFTLEYNHMGFYFGTETPNGIYLDYINIQVRLYEENGNIEFHIGPYSITEDPEEIFDGFPGPIIGILSNVQNYIGGTFGEVILLEGDPIDPIVTQEPFSFIAWPIPENTVYRFSRIQTNTEELNSNISELNIFPNPTSNTIKLDNKFDFDYIEIYSAEGKLLKTSQLNSVNLNEFQSGVYLVKIFNGKHSILKKVVKK